MPKPFKPSVKLTDNDVTNEGVYMNRRSLLKSMGFVGASTLLAKSAGAAGWFWEDEEEKAAFKGKALEFSQPPKFQITETRTPEDKVTSYNNFYEFGTDKSDPSKYAGSLVTKPWSIAIEGEVAKPGVVPFEYSADSLKNGEFVGGLQSRHLVAPTI